MVFGGSIGWSRRWDLVWGGIVGVDMAMVDGIGFDEGTRIIWMEMDANNVVHVDMQKPKNMKWEEYMLAVVRSMVMSIGEIANKRPKKLMKKLMKNMDKLMKDGWEDRIIGRNY